MGTPIDPQLARRLAAAQRKVSTAEQRRAAAARERDELVREALDAGATQQDVADLLGITKQAVGKIGAKPPEPPTS